MSKALKNAKSAANSLVVLDFETSGLSPNMGDRVIEIGAVKLQDGEVVASFQQLMNPGFRISGFIENYTGIKQHMLDNAASCEDVMFEFSEFLGDSNLVAHNASFDQRFLDWEFRNLALGYKGEFVCSMLLARRLYQRISTHKLGSLIKYKKIPNKGNFHRALYDAEMTAKLWLRMLEDITIKSGVSEITFAQTKKLSKVPKKNVSMLLKNLAG
jgi:DNA polymerase-3 subunit epsilon